MSDFVHPRSTSVNVTIDWFELLPAIRKIILIGDPDRFTLDEARELEALARDIRRIYHERHPDLKVPSPCLETGAGVL